MKDQTIEELAELVERGTPRPWSADPVEQDSFYEDVNILRPDGLAVAVAVQNGVMLPEHVAANAALIVAAVNALPSLLAEVKALRGRDKALQGALEECFAAGRQIDALASRLPDQPEKVRALIGHMVMAIMTSLDRQLHSEKVDETH